MKHPGLFICAVLFLLLACSCSVTLSGGGHVAGRHGKGPPPHAPAHGHRRKHVYRYYPTSYVYFDVRRRLYFYRSGGGWRRGARLPSGLRIDAREAVHLSLETDCPYMHSEEHRAAFPPGHAKGHGRSRVGPVRAG